MPTGNRSKGAANGNDASAPDDAATRELACQLAAASANTVQLLTVCADALCSGGGHARELAARALEKHAGDAHARTRLLSGGKCVDALVHALSCDHDGARAAAADALAALACSKAAARRVLAKAGTALVGALAAEECLAIREAATRALSRALSSVPYDAAELDTFPVQELAKGVLGMLRAASPAGPVLALDLVLYAHRALTAFHEHAEDAGIVQALATAGRDTADKFVAYAALLTIENRKDDQLTGEAEELLNDYEALSFGSWLLDAVKGASTLMPAVQGASTALPARALRALTRSDGKDIDQSYYLCHSAATNETVQPFGKGGLPEALFAMLGAGHGSWEDRTAAVRYLTSEAAALRDDVEGAFSAFMASGALPAVVQLLRSCVSGGGPGAADRGDTGSSPDCELDEVACMALKLLGMCCSFPLECEDDAAVPLIRSDLPGVLLLAADSRNANVRAGALELIQIMLRVGDQWTDPSDRDAVPEIRRAVRQLHLDLTPVLMRIVSTGWKAQADLPLDVDAAIGMFLWLPRVFGVAAAQALVDAGAVPLLMRVFADGHAPPAPDELGTSAKQLCWVRVSEHRHSALVAVRNMCSRHGSGGAAACAAVEESHMPVLAAPLRATAQLPRPTKADADAAEMAAGVLRSLLIRSGESVRRVLVHDLRIVLSATALAHRFPAGHMAELVEHLIGAYADEDDGGAAARVLLSAAGREQAKLRAELAELREREQHASAQLRALGTAVGPPSGVHDVVFEFADGRKLGASRLLLTRARYYRTLLGVSDGGADSAVLALQTAEASSGVITADPSFSFEAYEALLRDLHSGGTAPLPAEPLQLMELGALALKLKAPTTSRGKRSRDGSDLVDDDAITLLSSRVTAALEAALNPLNCLDVLAAADKQPACAFARDMALLYAANCVNRTDLPAGTVQKYDGALRSFVGRRLHDRHRWVSFCETHKELAFEVLEVAAERRLDAWANSNCALFFLRTTTVGVQAGDDDDG